MIEKKVSRKKRNSISRHCLYNQGCIEFDLRPEYHVRDQQGKKPVQYYRYSKCFFKDNKDMCNDNSLKIGFGYEFEKLLSLNINDKIRIKKAIIDPETGIVEIIDYESAKNSHIKAASNELPNTFLVNETKIIKRQIVKPTIVHKFETANELKTELSDLQYEHFFKDPDKKVLVNNMRTGGGKSYSVKNIIKGIKDTQIPNKNLISTYTGPFKSHINSYSTKPDKTANNDFKEMISNNIIPFRLYPKSRFANEIDKEIFSVHFELIRELKKTIPLNKNKKAHYIFDSTKQLINELKKEWDLHFNKADKEREKEKIYFETNQDKKTTSLETRFMSWLKKNPLLLYSLKKLRQDTVLGNDIIFNKFISFCLLITNGDYLFISELFKGELTFNFFCHTTNAKDFTNQPFRHHALKADKKDIKGDDGFAEINDGYSLYDIKEEKRDEKFDRIKLLHKNYNAIFFKDESTTYVSDYNKKTIREKSDGYSVSQTISTFSSLINCKGDYSKFKILLNKSIIDILDNILNLNFGEFSIKSILISKEYKSFEKKELLKQAILEAGDLALTQSLKTSINKEFDNYYYFIDIYFNDNNFKDYIKIIHKLNILFKAYQKHSMFSKNNQRLSLNNFDMERFFEIITKASSTKQLQMNKYEYENVSIIMQSINWSFDKETILTKKEELFKIFISNKNSSPFIVLDKDEDDVICSLYEYILTYISISISSNDIISKKIQIKYEDPSDSSDVFFNAMKTFSQSKLLKTSDFEEFISSLKKEVQKFTKYDVFQAKKYKIGFIKTENKPNEHKAYKDAKKERNILDVTINLIKEEKQIEGVIVDLCNCNSDNRIIDDFKFSLMSATGSSVFDQVKDININFLRGELGDKVLSVSEIPSFDQITRQLNKKLSKKTTLKISGIHSGYKSEIIQSISKTAKTDIDDFDEEIHKNKAHNKKIKFSSAITSYKNIELENIFNVADILITQKDKKAALCFVQTKKHIEKFLFNKADENKTITTVKPNQNYFVKFFDLNGVEVDFQKNGNLPSNGSIYSIFDSKNDKNILNICIFQSLLFDKISNGEEISNHLFKTNKVPVLVIGDYFNVTTGLNFKQSLKINKKFVAHDFDILYFAMDKYYDNIIMKDESLFHLLKMAQKYNYISGLLSNYDENNLEDMLKEDDFAEFIRYVNYFMYLSDLIQSLGRGLRTDMNDFLEVYMPDESLNKLVYAAYNLMHRFDDIKHFFSDKDQTYLLTMYKNLPCEIREVFLQARAKVKKEIITVSTLKRQDDKLMEFEKIRNILLNKNSNVINKRNIKINIAEKKDFVLFWESFRNINIFSDCIDNYVNLNIENLNNVSSKILNKDEKKLLNNFLKNKDFLIENSSKRVLYKHSENGIIYTDKFFEKDEHIRPYNLNNILKILACDFDDEDKAKKNIIKKLNDQVESLDIYLKKNDLLILGSFLRDFLQANYLEQITRDILSEELNCHSNALYDFEFVSDEYIIGKGWFEKADIFLKLIPKLKDKNKKDTFFFLDCKNLVKQNNDSFNSDFLSKKEYKESLLPKNSKENIVFSHIVGISNISSNFNNLNTIPIIYSKPVSEKDKFKKKKSVEYSFEKILSKLRKLS